MIETLQRLIKEILIGGSPRADKLWIGIIFLVDDIFETIAQKEAAHIVKMTLTPINKLGVVTALSQEVSNGKEVPLRFFQLNDASGWGGRKAGNDRLYSSYRTGTGGIHPLKPEPLFR